MLRCRNRMPAGLAAWASTVCVVGAAAAQQEGTVTLRADPAGQRVVLELLDEHGERVTLHAATVEIATAADGVVTGTLDLTAAGEIELCPPVAESPRVVIGVTTEPLTAALAAQLRLDPGAAIVVAEVSGGLPAEAAGVCAFDVITAVDGEHPVTQDSLRTRIERCAPGDVVTLEILRGGRPMRCEVATEAYVETELVVDAASQWLTVVPQIVTTDRLMDATVSRDAIQSYALLYQDALAQQDLASRYYTGALLRNFEYTAEERPRARLRGEIETLRQTLDNIETLLDELDAGDD